jgi:hypothetical protein
MGEGARKLASLRSDKAEDDETYCNKGTHIRRFAPPSPNLWTGEG